ncbi:MAG: maltose alpha-D-glucosyltransferase, partial [Acidobacteriota bacterium]|nr:maltose alpha-D-glucosyltransferase [Acidobacteriota bacterium]
MLDDPLWYKDAIIYELHVRAFQDGNADGRGDFRGLMERLDYIQDLGVTAIWLLPFYPSPWRDDGYDISGYTSIHPAYGDLKDFQAFLKEAHRRGIRVITELVLNHTSDQHPWFQRSRRAKPGSRWRDFYVWSATPDKYKEARVIFKDFHNSNWTWDPVAKAYYWHRFFDHQPDLNFDNPLVRRAMTRVVDFWLDQGVDGFRLDAITYIFEREGTNCDNLPETHAYLQELRAHIDSRYPNRMLLGEANLWPEDAITYFGPKGNECNMSFHFPLMPRLFTAIRMEDRFPIVEIMRQTPAIPENCQWALFLRNHDELTLEMVTDEERDYMYRLYAQDPRMRLNLGIRRRLAPLLENDRRRIELMTALLFALPGTPVIYYGDEIGMGDNVYLGDRNGVRTPMQWSSDRNAGFSRANPQSLYLPINIDPEYHYEAVNVEIQQANSHSLLWWTKRLIGMRRQVKAFGRGTLEFIQPENRRVIAFYRQFEGEMVLVVANLSRFVQAASLDLSAAKGRTPVEMFGKTELPPVGDSSYLITLGAYEIYWFRLEVRDAHAESISDGAPADSAGTIEITAWDRLFEGESRKHVEAFLPDFLLSRRWFRAAGRRLVRVILRDTVSVPETTSWLLMTDVIYENDERETYALLASLAFGEESRKVREQHPEAAAIRLRVPSGEEGILYSALWDRGFAAGLYNAIVRKRRLRGERGELVPVRTPAFIQPAQDNHDEPVMLRTEQTNNSFTIGQDYVLKLFRRLDTGAHPEVELGRYLTEQAKFMKAAPLAGYLEYRAPGEGAMTIGVLHTYVRSEATMWEVTLDALGDYFESARFDRQTSPPDLTLHAGEHLLALAQIDPPQLAIEWMPAYRATAHLLGERTADLHLALSANREDPA